MNKEIILRVLKLLARCSDRVVRDHARGIFLRLSMAEDSIIDAIVLEEEVL